MKISQKNEEDANPEKITNKPVWKLTLIGTGWCHEVDVYEVDNYFDQSFFFI